MLTFTRSAVAAGPGRFHRAPVLFAAGHAQVRAAVGRAAPGLAPMPYTLAGPFYKGMDPSDPLTYVRAWNPQPGMIALLNFDGAQLQGRTPTQLQRGPQTAKRRLRVGGR